jgi:hypothetical protein
VACSWLAGEQRVGKGAATPRKTKGEGKKITHKLTQASVCSFRVGFSTRKSAALCRASIGPCILVDRKIGNGGEGQLR